METHRRRFLARCGVVGAGAFAGCAGGSADDGTPTGEPTTRSTPTGSPTGTPAEASTAASGEWAQRAKLLPDDGDGRDFFGASVAVSDDGSTAVVGAFGDEDPNGENAGVAYVFEATDGAWAQRAALTPTDAAEGDRFGSSVALSGDGSTAVVGAARQGSLVDSADTAYVFSVTDGSWTQRAKLAPADGNERKGFGGSVAVSGDGTTALVGASRDEDPNGEDAGSAYVFEATEGSWTQETKLAADDGDGRDFFGAWVALSNDGSTALVSAFRDEDPNGDRSGSAYVFSTADGSWTQRAKLVPEDGDADDWFGWSVGLSGDGRRALVGAFRDDPAGENAGSAYVFSTADGSWAQRAKLTADDGDGGDWFGRSVALSGDGSTALVSALKDEDPNGVQAGSAYVFTP